MPRLTENERSSLLMDSTEHWDKLEAQTGKPFEIENGYSAKQFKARVSDYETKTKEIRKTVEVTLPQLRAERDAKFGASANDETGVWFYLARYKPMVVGQLGGKHPLCKTIPNVGRTNTSRYVSIMESFVEHWDLVNQSLASGLTIGSYDLNSLKADLAYMKTRMKSIQTLEKVRLPLLRAEREMIFGDVPENERDRGSLVARLLLYRSTVEAFYPNQPLSQTLPTIFPSSSSESTPTFPFNWVTLENGRVQTWFSLPATEGASQVFFQEGVVEKNAELHGAEAGSAVVNIWDNVAMVGELDLFEIRDAEGRTLLRGVREPSLPQPATA